MINLHTAAASVLNTYTRFLHRLSRPYLLWLALPLSFLCHYPILQHIPVYCVTYRLYFDNAPFYSAFMLPLIVLLIGGPPEYIYRSFRLPRGCPQILRVSNGG